MACVPRSEPLPRFFLGPEDHGRGISPAEFHSAERDGDYPSGR